MLALIAACDGPAAEIWVAPDGTDDGPGTRERPFATLTHARNTIRQIPADRGAVTVYVRGGRYELSDTFTLDERDHDVRFVAAEGEHPIVSGGRFVTGWRAGDAGVAVADVALPDFRQVWLDGVRLARARGPAPALELAGDLETYGGVAGYIGPEFPALAEPAELELGYLLTWQHKQCGVAAIHRSTAGVTIDMDQPCFFLITHHVRDAMLPSFMENAIELVDEPGEWYFRRATGELFVLPPNDVDITRAEMIVPALEELVRIDASQDITFEGITFADASWLRPSTYGHPDVQANFVTDVRDLSRTFWRDHNLVNLHDEYWKSPGAVVVDGARSITFERCTFTRLGGAGLDLQAGARDNIVRGNRFFDISANGIQVGDVTTEDHHPSTDERVVRDNEITNNVIRDVGTQYEDSVGIWIGYTDRTVVTHNLLENLPYTAISVGWGWGETDAGGGAYAQPFFYDTPTPSGNNVIARNEIREILQERSDGAGIYTLGNQPGTVIEANYIHAAAAFPGGIYLDEGSGFIEVVGNSVFAVPEPYFPHNFVQDRNATCNVHDNYWGVDVDVGAGLLDEYRDLR